MSSSSQRPKDSFDDVIDLGSIPPPGGVVGPDVHAARTAIAAMPMSLLEELRRAKRDRAPSFTNEAPTKPGKDGMRLLRPQAPDVDDVPPPPPASDLASAVEEVIQAAPPSPPPLPPPRPRPPVVKTPPMGTPAPVIAAPSPAPAMPPAAPSIITPISSQMPMPMVASMAEQLPQEETRPAVRIELLVALMILGGTGVVFALLALADRFLNHR
jgi:hypothetical protein